MKTAKESLDVYIRELEEQSSKIDATLLTMYQARAAVLYWLEDETKAKRGQAKRGRRIDRVTKRAA